MIHLNFFTLEKMINKLKFRIITIFSLLLLASCGGKNEELAKNVPPPTPTVDVVLLKAGQVANVIEIPGSVIPGEEVVIYSEVAGRIERIGFKESQVVQKGTLLFEVDTDILKAQRSELQVNLKLAQKEESRKKSLFEAKGISEEEYERFESQVESTKAKIDLINTQISKAVIRAPFTGRIGLRRVSNGALISPTTQLTTLVQENPIKIEFSVSERYASAVKIGQKIQFSVPNREGKMTASVYAYEPKVDDGTRMLTVRAELKNTQNLIAGTLVAVEYDLGFAENAFMVPAESIIPILNGQKVYVVRGGVVVEVPVAIGIRTADEVQIIGDLKNKDQVLTTGLLAVKAGVPVKVTITKR